MYDVNKSYMDEILHGFRRVFKRGGSMGITLPPEAGFVDGDGAAWSMEDGKLILSKAIVQSTDIQYTIVDRKRRKNDLYEQIKNVGERVKEDFLLARFAIDHDISLRILHAYRDELINDGLIHRIGDTLQSVQ